MIRRAAAPLCVPGAADAGEVKPCLEHSPVLRPRIGPDADPVPEPTLQRFRESTASDVSDLVGRLYTMDAGIAPLYSPIRRLVGSALTVKAVPGDNWAILGALGQARPGEVLVVDWHGYHDGCGSGALSVAAAIERGLAGVVIDGAWRDVAEIAALEFPIFGRGTSAYSPAKRELGEINVPVSCGGVVVEPGDLVVADEDGVAVVPRTDLDLVAGALSPAVFRGSLADYRGTGVSRATEERTARYRRQFDERASG